MSTKQRFLNRLRLLASALNPFPHASGYQFVLGQVPQTAEEQLEKFFRRFEVLPLELQYFITDFMLRRCVMVVCEYVIYAAGFDTRLESTVPPPADTDAKTHEQALLKQYGWVKDFVDEINKQINLDEIIFSAAVQMCLYGRAAFEIIRDKQGIPVRLNVLEVHPDKPDAIKPVVDEHTGKLVKFTLKTRDGEIIYRPEEILYFVNTDLDSSYYGLSDVIPALPAC
ncbi:MAG: phage portal protein, partial [Nitrososphaerota archaeon]|nr:phage portal protein [Nitrososphaerota archaeon]